MDQPDLFGPPSLTDTDVSELRETGWVIAGPDKTWIHITVAEGHPPEVTAVAGPVDGVIDALTGQGYTVYRPGEKPYAARRAGRSRSGGPSTSTQGARDVERRSGTQAHLLLAAYGRATEMLTDEQAASMAGLSDTCYWKRCGELREDGLIETLTGDDGEPLTAIGSAGSPRILCRVTPAGRALLERLG